jgi:hypothetical protein
LKYITKEDDEPLYNVCVSKLNFRARAIEWGKKTEVFSILDPFVMEHKHMYKFMKELHGEIRKKFHRVGSTGRLRRVEEEWSGWQGEVVQWWNDRIKFGKSARALYLYGVAGSGKSTVVESLVKGLRVYSPVNGQFFCGDYVVCDVVVFEEFCWDRYQFNLPQLKRLLEGRYFSVDVKCSCSKQVLIDVPVILVSNYAPKEDPAFTRRFRVVEASVPFWCGERALVREIKEEVVSEGEDVIDLCSSEDETADV